MGRMEDSFEMWKLVRLLKKNKTSLAMKLVDEEAATKVREFRYEEIRTQRALLQEQLGRELTKEEISKIRAEARDDNEESFKSYIIYRQTNSYHKEATVKRDDLIALYVSKYFKKLCPTDERNNFISEPVNIPFQEKKIYASSILESCMASENAYICPDPANPRYVYLTTKGKNFASRTGWFKMFGKELTEIVLAWRGLVLAVIAIAGAASIQLLKSLTSSISPWW